MEQQRFNLFIMEQHKLFNSCQCQSPGFCHVFNRKMGLNPPDWEWCQKSTAEDRRQYHELLSRGPPPTKKKLSQLLIENKHDHKKIFLHYLTQHNKHHFCEKAGKNQDLKNIEIWEYITNQKKSNVSFDNIQILCLGHKQSQFDTIQDRPYLTKIDLNNINAGKWSGNEWTESRAFIAYKHLLNRNTDFVGFVTASWNTKYEPYSKIDNFTNWNHSKLLLRSKPEDNIVLCADIFCPCIWIKEKEGILTHLFVDNAMEIGKEFLQLMNLKWDIHIRVPFSNQIIAHRKVFEKYKNYLDNIDAFEKINWFIQNVAHKHMFKNDDLLKNEYLYKRFNGYFVEMLTCFWFANQNNFLYIPNAEKISDWYSYDNMSSRL